MKHIFETALEKSKNVFHYIDYDDTPKKIAVFSLDNYSEQHIPDVKVVTAIYNYTPAFKKAIRLYEEDNLCTGFDDDPREFPHESGLYYRLLNYLTENLGMNVRNAQQLISSNESVITCTNPEYNTLHINIINESIIVVFTKLGL